jgi:hypothetical protein
MRRLMFVWLAVVMPLVGGCGGGNRSTAKSLVDCLSSKPGFTQSFKAAQKLSSGIFVPDKDYSKGKVVLLDFLHPDELLTASTVVFHKNRDQAKTYYDEQVTYFEKAKMPISQVDSYIVLKGNAVVIWPGGNSKASDRDALYGCLSPGP